MFPHTGAMPIPLAGGTLVDDFLGPMIPPPDAPRTRHLFGRPQGADAISLRSVYLPPKAELELGNGSVDEVLFVIEGHGIARSGQRSFSLAPETGLFLPPGTSWVLAAGPDTPLVLASSRCPDPEGAAAPESLTDLPLGHPRPLALLAQRKRERTVHRWYCTLLDQEVGSRQVTQFVGSIPPGRGPDHWHHYEEVLIVLRGQGVLWSGEGQAPIAGGSCIFLPKGQVHCLENTGQGELRVLGVFFPAGDPSVRYCD